MNTPKMNAHLDLAYTRWQAPSNNWTKQEFWDQLSAQERIAVFAGNLTAQVNNGGFLQWCDNGYATPEVLGFLTRLCKRLDTEASNTIHNLLQKFESAQRRYNRDMQPSMGWCGDDSPDAYDAFADACNELDDQFYATDDNFLDDIEATL